MGHIAVVDSVELYRHGLVDALRTAGHVVAVPADPEAWAGAAGGDSVVVIALRERTDLDALTALVQRAPDVPVVALVSAGSSVTLADALAAGATGVGTETSSPGYLLAAVGAALEGAAVLPVGLAHELGDGLRPELSGVEGDVLRGLAEGDKVHRIASRTGYSERTVYRVLRSLYDRLGVDGRTAAVSEAERRRLL